MPYKTYTMHNHYQPLLEAEVTRIADSLQASAHIDTHGLYWLTYNRHTDGTLFLEKELSIFGGTTGIIFFFIAMYQYSGKQMYLDTAIQATHWVENYAQTQKDPFVCFISGYTGIAYLYCKLYEVTQDSSYLSRATVHIQAIAPQLRQGNNIDDFISGEAGNIFVLMYVYAYNRSQELEELITICLNRLIAQARLSRKGVKWGYQPNSLDSLCGFSHGASGIGYVLLEASRYFANEALLWLASQSFIYESQYYRKKINNWIDLRIYTEYLQELSILNQKPFSLVVGKGDVNAWAHGTTGIGLVRLRAFEMTQAEVFYRESTAALHKTMRDLTHTFWADYSLCSGAGGMAEFILESSQTLAYPEMHTYACEVAAQAIRLRNTHGHYPSTWGPTIEDPSLLLGISGIGYLFLRLLTPDKVDSILLPRLPVTTSPKPLSMQSYAYSLSSIRQKVWGKHFKRTLLLLGQLQGEAVLAIFLEENFPDPSNEYKYLIRHLQTRIQTLTNPYRSVVQECFRLEKKQVAMQIDSKSGIYHQIYRQAQAQQWATCQGLSMESFLKQTFVRCRHIQILANHWDWSEANESGWNTNLCTPKRFFPLLLVSSQGQVEEYPISSFSYLILSHLHTLTSLVQLIESLKTDLSAHSPEEIDKLQTSSIAQVRQFIADGLVRLHIPVKKAAHY